MATSAVSLDQDVVTAEIFIAAPPERVFQAITDPKRPPQWWGQQQGGCRVTQYSSDVRVGGKWLSAGTGADGKPFTVEGEFLEIDPPRRLAYTWISSHMGPQKTTVHWELESREVHGLQSLGPQKMGTGTMVRIRHEGFARAPQGAAADHSRGWVGVLGGMQAFLEQEGKTVGTRSPVGA